MNPTTGGPSPISPADRQRQTAAEIARKKVLAAYSHAQQSAQLQQSAQPQSSVQLQQSAQFQQPAQPQPSVQSRQQSVQPTTISSQSTQPQTSTPIRPTAQSAIYSNSTANQPHLSTTSYKQAPIKTSQTTSDWRQYHSAWQNYYQKYYSEYYAKAARQYIETEKLKQTRAAHDATLENPHVASTPTPQSTLVQNASAADTTAVTTSLKDKIRAKAGQNFKLSRKHKHLIPIIAGVATVLLILFMQYNRLIFTPIMAYIAPGNVTEQTITAIDPTVTGNITTDPRLIIPKLNVDVPVSFGISNDNTTVMNAMNEGVSQWAIPGADAMPGEVGNLVITGHSSGDIYSNNQYKFIFSGLERLNDGDLIYINYEGKRYTYSVIKKETVEPTNVSVLVYETNKPMLTLITCTPLGTARYRLLVTAEQIDPAPSTTETPVNQNTNEATSSTDATMPANEPSFFEGIWNWLTGQN